MDLIQEQSSPRVIDYGWVGRKCPNPLTHEEALKKATDTSLAHYNSKHERQFELVEYLYKNRVSTLMDPTSGYNHLSFIAKTVDPPHKLKLFFAEVLSLQSEETYYYYVRSCTPVDPDTPFFVLGCGSCHPNGVIYHPLRGYYVGGYCDDPFPPYPSLSPDEKSAKELLSEKYTFKSSNQDLPPDEDKDFRKILDGYAREALIRKGFAVKLVKVVKAVRFFDFEPECLEDAVAWVHMVFLAQDAFCDAPEFFFAEYSIDCEGVGTCVRMTLADLVPQAETSCTICCEFCPMFHPEGEYDAGIGGGTFVDALDDQRSWGVRVYLEEKQPHVATQPGLCIMEQ